MLHVTARPRSALLAPLVRAFHYQEGELPLAIEQILPTGQAHLMINLDENAFRTYIGPECKTVHRVSGTVLAGPRGSPVAIDTREQRWLAAVEFKVGGAAAFLPMPASEVCNQVVELEDVWGREARLLRERLCAPSTPAHKLRVLEQALLRHLSRPLDPAIRAASFLLDRGVSVAEARARLDFLPKTFVRRFREQIGLTPKRFWRVRRLQRIVASVGRRERAGWSDIAAEFGYTDQAHFIHDFRALAGMTPTTYCPASPERRNHARFAGLSV